MFREISQIVFYINKINMYKRQQQQQQQQQNISTFYLFIFLVE